MTIFNYANSSQGICLSKFEVSQLTESNKSDYSYRTKAKSLVGICNPFYFKAHRRQLINAGFFMCTISTLLFFVNAFMRSRPNYGGLVEGTSVRRFLEYGIANLDQSTTSLRFATSGGGFKKSLKEAAIMATTPNTKPSKIYTFAIGKPKALHATFKRIRTVSTLALSESQARANLSGLRLTLIKCVPVITQEVAA